MKKSVLVAIIAIAGTMANANEDVAAAIAAQENKKAEARASVDAPKIPVIDDIFPNGPVNRAAAAGDPKAKKAQDEIKKANENIRRIKGGLDILK